jgi:hypothetical protein
MTRVTTLARSYGRCRPDTAAAAHGPRLQRLLEVPHPIPRLPQVSLESRTGAILSRGAITGGMERRVGPTDSTALHLTRTGIRNASSPHGVDNKVPTCHNEVPFGHTS